MNRTCGLLALGLSSMLVLVTTGATQAADNDRPATEPAKKMDKASLEKQFSELLTGATLDGYFTESPGDAKPHESKYVIDKVAKASGDTWIFTTRITYDGHDLTLPLPLPVLWAGNTPVITLDSVDIPGLGTFSARVLFHENQFAGTWSGGEHGGQLFGKVTHEGSKEKTAPAKSLKP